MKKIWKKPSIEIVSLVFDKEMATTCYSTSSTKSTPESAPCAIPGVSKCWTGGPQ